MPVPRPTTTIASATPQDAPHEPDQTGAPVIAMPDSHPFQYKIRNVGNPPFNQFTSNERLQLSEEEKAELDALAAKYGGHPQLSDTSIGTPTRYMDFSRHIFDDEVDFSGRVLVNVTFSNSMFNSMADFRGTTFVGTSKFDNASFCDRSRFDDAAFENTVYFKKTKFQETTVFDGAKFSSAAYFDESEFSPSAGTARQALGGAGFRNTTFAGIASFERVQWNVPINFDGASFEDNVNYECGAFGREATFQRATFKRSSHFSAVNFKRQVNFNDASFLSTTYFRRTNFFEPPMFFETKLHEDTDFSDIDWQKAESSYTKPWWSNFATSSSRRKSKTVVVDAARAIQAWDRLALIMSKLEKNPGRHNFYRLRMRAQRRRDGWGILSLANWFFNLLCDYGWNVRKALFWWSFHFLAMGLLLFSQASPVGGVWQLVLEDSLLVSFSNAHAFLGLASEGGYLHGSRVRLAGFLGDSEVLHTVGVIQTIVGPILLFLLLLTLRNRFRLR